MGDDQIGEPAMIPGRDFVFWAKRLGHTANYKTHLKYWLFRPGYQFVLAHRKFQYIKGLPIVGRILGNFIWRRNCVRFSSEIAQDAEIEAGLYTPHPYGIVLGVCKIGANVELLQNVTIGKRHAQSRETPTIGDGVRIGAGAVILGEIKIGSNATIGANSVVLKDVPDGATAIGSPAKIQNLEFAKHRIDVGG